MTIWYIIIPCVTLVVVFAIAAVRNVAIKHIEHQNQLVQSEDRQDARRENVKLEQSRPHNIFLIVKYLDWEGRKTRNDRTFKLEQQNGHMYGEPAIIVQVPDGEEIDFTK